MQYLIIGNGVAGTEAALAIRKNDSRSEITVLSQSNHHFYYRPRLIEYLAGKADLATFTLYKEEVYREKGITVQRGTPAAEIIPSQKKVIDTAGQTYGYDRLLVATGAASFRPAWAGADPDGVLTIRGVDDCDRLRARAGKVPGAVVIGGGLLGLEVAHSLVQLGIQVTVVEVMERLLPRQLDADGARLLQGILEQKGMRFILGTTVKAIHDNKDGKSLVLEDGNSLTAGLVVVSAGIRGRTELAREAGLHVEKGIVVNDHLETSVKDIYAAGDGIEHRGQLYGLWPAAREQGIVAGHNMSGRVTEYTGTDRVATLKVTGIDVYSAGELTGSEGTTDTFKDDRRYIKSIIHNNRLTGAIVVGDPQAVSTYQRVFEGTLPVTALKGNQETKGGTMDKYECSACGYIYDPEKGDDVGGIPPGTAFKDLPDDWVCPVCGVGKDQFKKA